MVWWQRCHSAVRFQMLAFMVTYSVRLWSVNHILEGCWRLRSCKMVMIPQKKENKSASLVKRLCPKCTQFHCSTTGLSGRIIRDQHIGRSMTPIYAGKEFTFSGQGIGLKGSSTSLTIQQIQMHEPRMHGGLIWWCKFSCSTNEKVAVRGDDNSREIQTVCPEQKSVMWMKDLVGRNLDRLINWC